MLALEGVQGLSIACLVLTEGHFSVQCGERVIGSDCRMSGGHHLSIKYGT